MSVIRQQVAEAGCVDWGIEQFDDWFSTAFGLSPFRLCSLVKQAAEEVEEEEVMHAGDDISEEDEELM